jgi:hypothetical protein
MAVEGDMKAAIKLYESLDNDVHRRNFFLLLQQMVFTNLLIMHSILSISSKKKVNV